MLLQALSRTRQKLFKNSLLASDVKWNYLIKRNKPFFLRDKKKRVFWARRVSYPVLEKGLIRKSINRAPAHARLPLDLHREDASGIIIIIFSFESLLIFNEMREARVILTRALCFHFCGFMDTLCKVFFGEFRKASACCLTDWHGACSFSYLHWQAFSRLTFTDYSRFQVVI